jgi:hypothetical protein
MKSIFLALLFFTQSVFAGPMLIKGQVGTKWEPVDRLYLSQRALTKVGPNQFLLEGGDENILINRDFQDTTPGNGWTVDATNTDGTGVSAFVKYNGAYSFFQTLKDQAYSNVKIIKQSVTYDGNFSGQDMEASIRLLTYIPYTVTAKLCVDVGGVQKNCVDIPRGTINEFRKYSFNFAGAAANTAYEMYIVATSSGVFGLNPSINYAKAYLGPARNIGSGTPPNEFTAQVSATGIITNSTPVGVTWISNCSYTSTIDASCPLTGFTSAPNCTIIVNSGSGAVNTVFQRIFGVTSSNLSANSVVTNTTTNAPFSVRCTKTGADYVQSTITPASLDFTNEFTAQVSTTGVVSSENQDFINGNAAITDTSLFTLTWVNGKFPLAPNCTATSYGSGPTTADVVEIETLPSTTGVAFRNMVGATKGAVGFTVHCSRTGTDYRQPINAPILIGSVTSNSNNAMRFESAIVATCTSSPCSISTQSSSWLTSVTRAGTGVYTFNYPGGTWGSAPTCVCSSQNGTYGYCAVFGSATTFTQIATFTGAGAVTDSTFNMICYGPR